MRFLLHRTPCNTFKLPTSTDQQITLIHTSGEQMEVGLDIGVKQTVDRSAVRAVVATAYNTVNCPTGSHHGILLFLRRGVGMPVVIRIIQPVNRNTFLRSIPCHTVQTPADGQQRILFLLTAGQQVFVGIGIVQAVNCNLSDFNLALIAADPIIGLSLIAKKG